MNKIFFKSFKEKVNKKTMLNLVSGFTLIELMVASSIFIIIMLASMSSFFVLLDSSRNSRALRTTMDNVNFTMEIMTRSIRMGTNYYCAESGTVNLDDETNYANCLAGGTLVAFKPSKTASSKISYQLNNGAVEKCSITECVSLTSPEVDISELKFFVKGSDPTDSDQASVYITMRGTVTIKGVANSFSLQTLASQRNFY